MAKGASGADAFTTSVTGWYYAAAVGGLLSTVAFVLALLWAPRWPAMGSRYDAPADPGRRPRDRSGRASRTCGARWTTGATRPA